MAYVKQSWHDQDPNYPADAARLGHMEDGIEAASIAADAAASAADAATSSAASANATAIASVRRVWFTVPNEPRPTDVESVEWAGGPDPPVNGTDVDTWINPVATQAPFRVPVFHGGDPDYPRPDADFVEWNGWVAPNNGLDFVDTWINTA